MHIGQISFGGIEHDPMGLAQFAQWNDVSLTSTSYHKSGIDLRHPFTVTLFVPTLMWMIAPCLATTTFSMRSQILKILHCPVTTKSLVISFLIYWHWEQKVSSLLGSSSSFIIVAKTFLVSGLYYHPIGLKVGSEEELLTLSDASFTPLDTPAVSLFTLAFGQCCVSPYSCSFFSFSFSGKFHLWYPVLL